MTKGQEESRDKMAERKLPKGITKRKDGRYDARFYYQGKRYVLYGNNVKKLEKELAELRYEVEHGLKGKGDNMTLNAWFEVWLDSLQDVRESTIVRYTQQFEMYLKKSLGKTRLLDFKQARIQRHFKEMAEAGYSHKTMKDTLVILKSMFSLAVTNDIIIKNPCVGVRIAKTAEKERRVLTVEEQREVLEQAKGRICEPLVHVALGTGMRAGELQGLTWNDIDFRNRTINVNKTLVYIPDKETGKYCFKYQPTKTNSGTRIIPMQEDVYKALKRQKVQKMEMQLHNANWMSEKGFEDLVFVNVTGRPRQGMDFRNDLDRIESAINKERKRVASEQGKEFEKIPHFHPHTLRHTFATRCFEAGIDAKTVQNYLGHSSVAITLDLYTHVTEDKAKFEMEKLNSLYQQICV